MKTLIILATALLLGYQAQASVTADEFTTDFIAQMNRRLHYTNIERKDAGKTLYCESLSPKQEKIVKDLLKKNPEITVGEFTSKLSDTMKCYPEFWAPWSRTKTTRGMLVNTKAYVMDVSLIQDVLADLNDGLLPKDYRKLLDAYTSWDDYLKGAQ